jgi:hypothetical protein
MLACTTKLRESITLVPSTQVETWVQVLRHIAMRPMLPTASLAGLVDQALVHQPPSKI